MARWGPLLALARRVGRVEEAARALLEALPGGLERAPLELELLRSLAEAEVSLGRPWWACPTTFTNASSRTRDGRHAIDLLEEGVQVLSGPGLLGRRLLPWPEGVPLGLSTQLHTGDEDPWYWLYAQRQKGDAERDLLALDPDRLAWAVVGRGPDGYSVVEVDHVAGEVVLRPYRDDPPRRQSFSLRPGAEPPRPRDAEPLPEWAAGMTDELGTAPLGAGALAFGLGGEALVAERGWRSSWAFTVRTGVPRSVSTSTASQVRIPLGAEARWRGWSASVDREGLDGLALVPRRGPTPMHLVPLPASLRPHQATLDSEGEWLFFVEPGGRLRARPLGEGTDWSHSLSGEIRWLLAGAGGVAALGVPEGGATLLEAATGELSWQGQLTERARPGHAGGLTRAGLLARHPDGAWLLRCRDSLVWLEVDGTATLVEEPEPEALPAPRSMAISPDGAVMVGWQGERLEARDPRRGGVLAADLRRPLLGDEGAEAHGPLAIDPTGSHLAYVEQDVIRLVNLAEALEGEDASLP
jgi:hypothetical protein